MTSPGVRAPVHHGPRWPWLAGIIGALAVGAALLFILLNPLSSEDEGPPPRYVDAVIGAPSRVNPLFTYMNDADRDIAALVFSGLTRLDGQGAPQPDLAASWEASPDGRTVTFNLRPGVKWHTGAAFTADDVLFTYSLLGDPALQGDPEQAQLWESLLCTAPEPLTLACTLDEPFSPFLTYTSIGILPKHILEATTPSSIFDDPFNRAPIGTGPFRLTQLDSSRAILRANRDYFGGPPGIEELELRFYPDVTSAAADLVRGEADGLLVDLTISPEDLETVSATPGLQGRSGVRSASTILYFNNQRPPFDDVFVRRAVQSALDLDLITRTLLGGRAVAAVSPLPPGTWAFDDSLDPLGRDLTLARNLLDAGGWELPPEGGVREKQGTELRLSLLADQDPLRGAVAQAIADQLSEIGIDATVVREPAGNLVRQFLIPRSYQAAIFGWDPGADPDPFSGWHSSQVSGEGRNLAGYGSSEADALIEDARQTFDLEERAGLYARFQEVFLEDIPSVPLYYPLSTYFVSDRVQGLELGVIFSPASRFLNVTEWTFLRTPVIIGDS